MLCEDQVSITRGFHGRKGESFDLSHGRIQRLGSVILHRTQELNKYNFIPQVVKNENSSEYPKFENQVIFYFIEIEYRKDREMNAQPPP